MASARNERHSHRYRRSVTRKAALAIGGAVACGAGLLYGTTACAMGSLDVADGLKGQVARLLASAEDLRGHISSGDYANALLDAEGLASASDTLGESLSAPLWNIAQFIPGYGDDLNAIKKLISSLSRFSRNALVPILSVLEKHPVDSLVAPIESGFWIDVPAIREIMDALEGSVPEVSSFIDTVKSMDAFSIEEIQSAVDKVKDLIESYEPLLDSPLLSMTPSLLRFMGAEGPKTYLMVAESAAEFRATGGFAGAVGFIYADAGTITFGDFMGISQLMRWLPADDPLFISEEERLVFGARLGYIPADMNCVPDFARASQLWQECCEREAGVHVDGTVAVDPYFLQKVLEALGVSVPMSDGTILDGGNTVRTLLRDVYFMYPLSGDQDRFFIEAASGALSTIASAISDGSLAVLAEVIGREAGTRHIALWSPDEEVERLFEDLGYAGRLSHDVRKPTTGVYFNDDSWAKLGWWFQTTAKVGIPQVWSDKSQTVPVQLTLTNTITQEEVNNATGYIVGSNPAARGDCDLLFLCYLFAPEGGKIWVSDTGSSSIDGIVPEYYEGIYEELPVVWTWTQLLPGESISISYEVTFPAGAEENLLFDVTPLGQPMSIEWEEMPA